MNVKEEYGNAFREVLMYLENTDDELLKKIPQEFKDFLNENTDDKFLYFNGPRIRNKCNGEKIKVQDLSDKAKKVLGVIFINWWCSDIQKDNYMKRIIGYENK